MRQGGQHCCRASEGGGGGGLSEIAWAAWPHAHRYLEVAGRPTLLQSLWRGGQGVGLDRALRPARHAHSDLQAIGGPPPLTERFQRGGGGRRPDVVSRRPPAAFGGAGGPPPPTAPPHRGCGGRSRTRLYLVGSLPVFAGQVVVHHCAQCLLSGGGTRSVALACARRRPTVHCPTHRRRAHHCDARRHHPHRPRPSHPSLPPLYSIALFLLHDVPAAAAPALSSV